MKTRLALIVLLAAFLGANQATASSGIAVSSTKAVVRALAARPLLVTSAVSNPWVYLGPSNTGGHINQVFEYTDPSSTTQTLIAATSGGLWYSADSGMTWTSSGDFLGTLSVSSLAQSGVYLLAGTGDGLAGRDGIGVGLLASTDVAQSWQPLSSTTPSASNNYIWGCVSSVVTTGAGILVATNNYCAANSNPSGSTYTLAAAVFLSTDNGSTWTQELTGFATRQLAVSPLNNMKVVADCGTATSETTTLTNSGGTVKVCYSTDGGATWSKSATLESTDARLAFAFSSQTTGLVYAYSSANGGVLYKSTNAGSSWASVTPSAGNSTTTGIVTNEFLSIWMDPTVDTHLAVGGLYVNQTLDSGSTWAQISDPSLTPFTPGAGITSLVNDDDFGVTTSGILDANVYVSTASGVYITDNISLANDCPGVPSSSCNASNSGWQFASGGPSTAVINSVSGAFAVKNTLTSQKALVAADLNVGALAYDGTPNWLTAYNDTSSALESGVVSVAQSQSDGNTFFAAAPDLNIERFRDGGSSPTEVDNFSDGASQCAVTGTCSAFLAPIVMDPSDENIVYAGGAHLWRTAGALVATPVWTDSTNPALDAGHNITAIGIDGSSSKAIWIGFDDGSVYKTADVTASTPAWTVVTITGAPATAVTSLRPDLFSDGVSFVTFSGYSAKNLFYSKNDGTSWTGVQIGSLVMPVYDATVNPSVPTTEFVASEFGIFVSTDSGVTWTTTNQGPANIRVTSLNWAAGPSSSGPILVAGTYGRGIWQQTEVAGLVFQTLSPASGTVGMGATTLVATGYGFTPQTLVLWNGASLATTYLGGAEVSATLPAADTDSVTNAQVTLSDPSSTYATAAITFKVVNPAPTVSLLTPDSASVGAATTTVTITGTNFVSGSTVTWAPGTKALKATYVSTTTLQAVVPSTYLASGTAATLAVSNAAPGGGTSGTESFNVLNPVPTLKSVNPTAVRPGKTVYVTFVGTNFNSETVLNITGTPIKNTKGITVAPATVTATGMAVNIPVTALPSAATYTLAAVNPGPGGGTTSTVPFAVTSTAPAYAGQQPGPVAGRGAVSPMILAIFGLLLLGMAVTKKRKPRGATPV